MTDDVQALVNSGHLEEFVDEFGEVRYSITPKMEDDYPALAAAWQDQIDGVIYSLWIMDLIDLSFTDSEVFVDVTPAGLAFDYTKLTKDQHHMIVRIIDLVRGNYER